MKKSILAFLWCLTCLAFSGDFEVVVFENALFNMPNPVQEVEVTFPSDGRTYSNVNLILTLEPPEGLDGDEWDRMGHIYLYNQEGQFTELARLITPYWNPPWTWQLDITEMQLLFQGTVRMGVWLQSWKDDGYQLDLSLDFTNGVPAELTTNVTNLWHGPAFGYGNAGNTRMERFFYPLAVPTSTTADKVLSRISVTGHRFVDNTNNAAEFLQTGRTLVVNGGGNWYNELWQECGSWPVQPQSPGTWYFDRAGWCPGDLVDPWIVDITAQVTPGTDTLLNYVADEYINLGVAQDATEYVGGQIVELRNTNTSIWRPSGNIAINGLTGAQLTGQSKTFNRHNFNASPASYTASATVPWLTVSPSALSLDAGQSAVIVVTINSSVQNLAAGSHQGHLNFADTTNNINEQRLFGLQLEAPRVVAHWKLDETNGTVASDSSGNGYDANLQGGLSFDSNSVSGRDGRALDFDGIDDLVDAGNVPLVGSFSLSTWVKPHDITRVSGFLHRVDRPSQQFLRHSFWLGQGGTDGSLYFGVYPSIFEKGMSSSQLVLVNETWIHVVATFDGTYQKLYVNGILENTGPQLDNGLPALDATLYLGRRNTADWFNGTLDDVRIFNYALTGDQVHWLLCPLDLNLDGTVDSSDLMVALANWPQGELLRDVNLDGKGNILDLVAFPAQYGACNP